MVDTPKVVAMNAPHVFHGTSGEVIVPASSNVRDKFLGFNPLFSYSSAYIRPGTIIDIYCSQPTMLAEMHVATVVAIKLPVFLANVRIASTNTSNILVNSSTPPKHIAIMISETVNITDSIPPLFKRLSTTSTPVSIEYPYYKILIASPTGTFCTKIAQ